MRSWLMLILLLAPSAAAIVPPQAAWVVAEDTTIEHVPFVLAQDVLVMPGATLSFRNVDAVALRNVNVTVLGSLEFVDGTSVAAAALPFDIYIGATGALLAEDATLVGARLALAGPAVLDEVSLTNGALRVLGGSTTARGLAMSGSTGALIEALGGALDLDEATLDGAGGPAVYVDDGAAVRLANITVGRTGDYGVRLEGGVARIENATFSLSPSYALYANGAQVDLVDSAFSTHCGAFLVGGAHGAILRNVFETIDHGVTLVSAGIVDVHTNDFLATQEALLVYGGTTDIRGNAFDSNSRGVHVLFGSSSAPLLRDNAFTGNGVALQNDLAANVDARWNWWGSAGGPASGDVAGPADVSPWLAAAP